MYLAVTCVSASFPQSGCFWDGCYLCVCLLPWVRLFRDGCYLCVCLLPWQVAVTCVFASFPDRWLLPVFLPSSLSQVVWRWLLPVFLPPSLTEVAVTCVFASFPDRGGCYLCFCLLPRQRWLLPVCLPPSLTEVAVTCVFASFPDRGGCYLLFASFHESGHSDSEMAVTCVFAPFPEAESEMAQRWLLPVFCCGCLCVSGTPCAPPQRLLAHCWLPSSPSSPSSARTTSQYCFTCLCFGLWTDYCRHERCFSCDSKCVDAVFTLYLFVVVVSGGNDDTRLCWCLPQYLFITVSVYHDLFWLFEGHEWVWTNSKVSVYLD